MYWGMWGLIACPVSASVSGGAIPAFLASSSSRAFFASSLVLYFIEDEAIVTLLGTYYFSFYSSIQGRATCSTPLFS